jgi:putative ABC transport system ATP-binding protein
VYDRKENCARIEIVERENVANTNNQVRRVVLRATELTKDLPLGAVVVHAVRGIDLEIYDNEMVGIVGPSGSGKSTLLGLIGGLDSPTTGRVEIDGVDITHMSEGRLTEVRNEKIGFVFQFFNLIPTLTALENVALPIQFAQHPKYDPEKRARELLSLLGLQDRLNHRPMELSGGQQQRVAIARALANNPPLLLADEPTGNLDSEASEVVLEALRDVWRGTGTTVVLVTHDRELAARMDRVLHLSDGRLTNEAARA